MQDIKTTAWMMHLCISFSKRQIRKFLHYHRCLSKPSGIYRCASMYTFDSFCIISVCVCVYGVLSRVFRLTLQNNRMYNMNVECLMRVFTFADCTFLPFLFEFFMHFLWVSLSVFISFSFLFLSFILRSNAFLHNSFCRTEWLLSLCLFSLSVSVCAGLCAVCNYFRFQ